MSEIPGPFPEMGTTIASVESANVLNSVLYNRLVARFDSVIIAKQGETMFGGGYTVTATGKRYEPLCSGEYYRVCCPFCLRKGAVDTRHRLWINHRWGVGLDPSDPEYDPQDKFWWMAHCYNEHCMEDPANRKELQTWIFTAIGRERRKPAMKVRHAPATGAALGLVDYPGECQRIDTLPTTHKAYQYILGRSMDPQLLGPEYNLSFCHSCARWPAAANKLIIPIYMGGNMVGWQARPPYDIDWKAAGQGKYYNLPGMNKRLMLYGYDQAKSVRFCTVVEGVTDVWALGPGTVSLLGKSISPDQANMLAAHWDAVVLALDPDAGDRIEKIRKILSEGSLKDKVISVTLPDGVDPATVNKDYFWDLVNRQADVEGVELP